MLTAALKTTQWSDTKLPKWIQRIRNQNVLRQITWSWLIQRFKHHATLVSKKIAHKWRGQIWEPLKNATTPNSEITAPKWRYPKVLDDDAFRTHRMSPHLRYMYAIHSDDSTTKQQKWSQRPFSKDQKFHHLILVSVCLQTFFDGKFRHELVCYICNATGSIIFTPPHGNHQLGEARQCHPANQKLWIKLVHNKPEIQTFTFKAESGLW